MTIMRWDPFGELLGMQRDLERVFHRLGAGQTTPSPASSIAWMPKMDVKMTGDDMIVCAEVPGMSKDDVEIELTDNILTIKGERKTDTEKTEEGWLIRERSYGSFERSLVLPEGIKPDEITADYTDGVLEIRIPKASVALKPQTHKIALTKPASEPPSGA